MKRILNLLAIILMTTSVMMAQDKKSFTLEDLMPGGNNYFNLQPKNIQGLRWWGDLMLKGEIEELKAFNPATNKEETLVTLQEVNELLAAKNLGKIHHFYSISMPYEQKWLLLTTRQHRVLMDLDTKEIIWNQAVPAKAANQDWNQNSRALAYTIFRQPTRLFRRRKRTLVRVELYVPLIPRLFPRYVCGQCGRFFV